MNHIVSIFARIMHVLRVFVDVAVAERPFVSHARRRVNIFNPLAYVMIFLFALFASLCEFARCFYGLFVCSIREGVADYKSIRKIKP